MPLGPITFTATLNSTGRWVLLQLASTGMTTATIYRVTPEGPQPVRGALNKAVIGNLNAADYEAPQNATLTYFARISDGTMTQDSLPVTVTGQVDRGGDYLFGLVNPLAGMAVNVVGFSELSRSSRQEVVTVIGRPDPVVVSDVLQYPTGTMTVATLTDSERLNLLSLAAGGTILAFSPRYTNYGFSDVWYLSVSRLTEQRVSRIGTRPERLFTMEFQRVSPPPANFVGPAFRTWQQVFDSGVTWGSLLSAGTTWSQIQVA